MSTGTKVILASLVAFVALIATYYGFSGGDDPILVTHDQTVPAEPGARNTSPNILPQQSKTKNKPSALHDKSSTSSADTRRTPPPIGSQKRTRPGFNLPKTTSSNRGTMPVNASTNQTESFPAGIVDLLGPLHANPAAISPNSLVDRPNAGDALTSAVKNAAYKPDLSESSRTLRSRETSTNQNNPKVQPAASTGNRDRSRASRTYANYKVKAGQTMSLIAEEWFGDAGKWDLIARANPLVDPARLSIGQTLRLPPKDTTRRQVARQSSNASKQTHTVRSGDTLTQLAQAYYGTSTRWVDIYRINRRIIGSNPDRLKVGMRLTIPSGT